MDSDIDFYENNDEKTLAVLGSFEESYVGVYDDRKGEGVLLRTREEAEYVRDALTRWLDDGGK